MQIKEGEKKKKKKQKDTLDALLSAIELGKLIRKYLLAENAIHPSSKRSKHPFLELHKDISLEAPRRQ